MGIQGKQEHAEHGIGVSPPLVGRPGASGESGSQGNCDHHSTTIMDVEFCGHVIVVPSFMSSHLSHLVNADLSRYDSALASCTCVLVYRATAVGLYDPARSHTKVIFPFL